MATTAFAYDNVGNPTTYKNDTLVWTGGRRLKSYLKNDSSYLTTFMYNGDGLRTQKRIQKGTNSFETHTYYWSDGKLLAETIQLDNNTPIRLKFHYSHAGLTGFTYSKEPFMGEPIIKNYTYIKNSLGDIVGIYSSTGVMCTYTYDAWGGNCTITDHAFEIGIGYISAINPFRYRGYYFDSDLGLYYLQTRYYDPSTGRFINADKIKYTSSQSSLINGLNAFCYCVNNPVMNSDPGGCLFGWLIALIVIAAVAAAAVTTSVITAEVNFNHNKKQKLPEFAMTGKYINNQAALDNYNFGFGNVENYGCGAIAIYNVLVSMGETPDLAEIIRYMDTWGENFFGLSGSNPYMIKHYLVKHGYNVNIYYNQIDSRVANADTSIIVYLNNSGALNGHFFNAEKSGDNLNVYNNNDVIGESLESYLQQKGAFFKMVICINKVE